MREEIEAAVLFLCNFIKKGGVLSTEGIYIFKLRMCHLLRERFLSHWHPHCPWKGQAYRCIRMNGTLRKDSTIARAATDSGIKYEDLRLPLELTIWVDPKEVSCRFGEHGGSYCTIAEFHEGETQNFIDQIDLSQFFPSEDAENEKSLDDIRKASMKMYISSRSNHQEEKDKSISCTTPTISQSVIPIISPPRDMPPPEQYLNQPNNTHSSPPEFSPCNEYSLYKQSWVHSQPPSPVSQLPYQQSGYYNVRPVYSFPENFNNNIVHSSAKFNKFGIDKLKLNFQSLFNGVNYNARHIIALSAM